MIPRYRLLREFTSRKYDSYKSLIDAINSVISDFGTNESIITLSTILIDAIKNRKKITAYYEEVEKYARYNDLRFENIVFLPINERSNRLSDRISRNRLIEILQDFDLLSEVK
jgi:hypothetical protein